jgi:hypothetical protein
MDTVTNGKVWGNHSHDAVPYTPNVMASIDARPVCFPCNFNAALKEQQSSHGSTCRFYQDKLRSAATTTVA